MYVCMYIYIYIYIYEASEEAPEPERVTFAEDGSNKLNNTEQQINN